LRLVSLMVRDYNFLQVLSGDMKIYVVGELGLGWKLH